MQIDPGSTLLRHQLMRQPSWFRQERTFAATGQSDLNRGVNAYLVTWRDEERLVPGSRADRRSDNFATIDERCVGAKSALGFFVLADEPALRATDGWSL